MKKILITGSVGFIGFHLSEYLLNKNYFVLGIDNLNDYYDVNLKKSRLKILKKHKNFSFKKKNINDVNLKKIFSNFDPDIVIHLAAQAGVRYSIENPLEYVDSNLKGFVSILEICRKLKIKNFLYASSSSVYGANSKIPFSEKDRTDNPVNIYAATKKSNELIAHSYSHLFNLNCIGLRFFTVYGPWGRPDMSPMIFAKKILEGEKLTLFNGGNMFRDYTYIDDVVKCIYKLMVSKKNKFDIFNIGNSNPIKINKFLKLLENNFNKKAIIINKKKQAGDMMRTFANTKKIQKKIIFSPKVSVEEGVKKFTDWYAEYFKN